MKTLAAALLLMTASGPATAGGDPVAGKSTAIICIGCHNSDGNSSNPVYPKLAGQGEAYLAKQLADFKSGARKEEHMTSMVEAIEKADIPNLAAYFASQKRSPGLSNKTKSKQGKQIFHNGISAKGISACDGCHGTDGKGNPAIKFPSLANQHAEYVAKMLKEFRSGTRHNDPGEMMRNIATKLSDKEIESVANYVAGLN